MLKCQLVQPVQARAQLRETVTSAAFAAHADGGQHVGLVDQEYFVVEGLRRGEENPGQPGAGVHAGQGGAPGKLLEQVAGEGVQRFFAPLVQHHQAPEGFQWEGGSKSRRAQQPAGQQT